MLIQYHHAPTSAVQILTSELLVIGEDHLPPILAVLVLFS
jgi:hypothetical protein